MLFITIQAKFPLGRIVITPNATSQIGPDDINDGLRRHARGDWGHVDADDAAENERSLQDGYRLLSAYGEGHHRFWIITEADRSVTTVLLPEDY